MIMKRLLPLLLICLLVLAPAAHAALAPDASALADALRGTPYEGYTLSCQTFAMQYGEPGNSSAYAIAFKDGKNVLCAFEKNEGDWYLRVANENALPVDVTQLAVTVDEQWPRVTIEAETQNGSVQLQFIIGGDTSTPYTWKLFSVMVTAPGADGNTLSITQVTVSEETGKWEITENGNYTSYENRAYLRMDDFDLRDFPLTKAAADAVWYREGTLVYLEREDGEVNAGLSKLVGREIMLPGNQMLPVYSGPDESYLRGANGKAAVSTNEPVTVYAADRDWVLISYGVSSGERFGYIPRSSMPADVSIDHELYQGSLGIGLTTREVAVLDNLSEPDKPLCMLSYSSPLYTLATLGEWLYISGTSDQGDPCCGFIPADALHHTNNF